MNFVCIVFELGDKMLTLSSMENLIVQCNLNKLCSPYPRRLHIKFGFDRARGFGEEDV